MSSNSFVENIFQIRIATKKINLTSEIMKSFNKLIRFLDQTNSSSFSRPVVKCETIIDDALRHSRNSFQRIHPFLFLLFHVRDMPADHRLTANSPQSFMRDKGMSPFLSSISMSSNGSKSKPIKLSSNFNKRCEERF